MPAYLIALVTVTDAEQYAKYTRLTPAAIAKFGGRFVVRGGLSETLEGPLRPGRVVVIEFPSFEQASQFYHSAEYQEARKLREGAAEASFILAEGWDER
jgi:uncharacterized protein (DUF1330 family)